MNHAPAAKEMIDVHKFNEYEQREAKNFDLLDSSKDEFTSSCWRVLGELFAKLIKPFIYFRIKEARPENTQPL